MAKPNATSIRMRLVELRDLGHPVCVLYIYTFDTTINR